MNRIALTLLLAAAMTGASAAEIYKWVDADGNIHYGDRPVGDGMTQSTQVEVVAIATRRTDPEQVKAGVEARHERDNARADARAEREAAKQEEEQARAEAAARAEKCTAYRARLEKFTFSRRLYRLDDDGERQYLDDAQMADARAQVQKQVEEYCSS